MSKNSLTRDLLNNCARNFPTKIAYIDGDRKISWRETEERAKRFALVLQDLGIGKGDTVAILSGEHIEMCDHIFACLMIGAVRVGINTGFSQKEIMHIINDSNARLILVDASYEHKLEGLTNQLISDGIMLMGYGGNHSLPLDFAVKGSAGDLIEQLPDLNSDDLALISYTSGTTGLPKGVVVSQRALYETLTNTVLNMGLQHEDVWFNSLVNAWITVALSIFNVANGMTVVVANGSFEIHRFLRFVDQYKVTSTILVPVMMQRLITAFDEGEYDLSSLRLIVYGSAPSTPSLILRMLEKFPDTKLLQVYGLTEMTGGWVTYLYHNDHLRGLNDKPELLTSAGRLGLHMEAIIADGEGNSLDHGEIGELWIKSDTRMIEYHNLPQLTKETLDGDWLRTHDIAKMDADGYIYLVDRKNFLIITGAANVYPSLVENTIAEHPAVREVSVVGAPHPEWGEAVVAMVSLYPNESASNDELIHFCKDKLSKFSVPKYIEIVDDLPKGVTGKILKKEIKAYFKNNSNILPWFKESNGMIL